ncbi:uncharacterized protein hmgxb4b isoform 2-T2 [Spinachia spinachia]
MWPDSLDVICDKGAEGLLNREMHPSDNIESCGFPPAYPICLPQGQWEERRGEEDIQETLLRSCYTADVHIEWVVRLDVAQFIPSFTSTRHCFLYFFSLFLQASPSPITEYWVYSGDQHNMADCAGGGTFITPPNTPVSHRPCPFTPVPVSVAAAASAASTGGTREDACAPIGPVCGPTSSDWDALSPGCSDGDPACAAAHLHLLGESLSLIGRHLQETNKAVSVSCSASLLLDSLLCAAAPLIGLTAQIPQLESCTRHTLRSTLENISYLMPGL